MGDSKKAFDFSRGNIFVCDPTSELVLVGGKDFYFPPEQQSPFDTSADKSNPLFDERLGMLLEEEFINNIDAYGVLEPVLIAKIDGLACVVDGRQRVRAARAVNHRRAKKGEPPVKVDAKMVRTDDTGLIGRMIATNEGRFDDTQATRIEKLKRLMERGVSIEDAAVTFKKSPSTLKQWLAFEDGATSQLKKAVEQGRIAPSAGYHLAKLDPEKQAVELDKLLAAAPATGKITRSAVKTAAKKATKNGASNAVDTVSVRDQRKLLKAMKDMSHPKATERSLAWWEGAEAMLEMLLGEDEVDERLLKALERVRAGDKAEA